MNTEEEIDHLQGRNLDILREVSFQLWSNLIVVNGLLLTVVLGIAAFDSPTTALTKVMLLSIILALILSSAALIWNIVTTKMIFYRIGEVLGSKQAITEQQRQKDMRHALNGNARLLSVERFAFVVLGIAVILLCTFVWNVLYGK